jgi:hypothetical protein
MQLRRARRSSSEGTIYQGANIVSVAANIVSRARCPFSYRLRGFVDRNRLAGEGSLFSPQVFTAVIGVVSVIVFFLVVEGEKLIIRTMRSSRGVAAPAQAA